MKKQPKRTTRQIFSQMLIKLRKNKGISRKKLAEDLGVSSASIGYYENADRVPDIEVLVKIADYFNVTCDELLRGVKSPDKNVYKDLWLSDKALNTLRDLNKTEPINEKTQISYLFEFFNNWLESRSFIDFLSYYYRYSIGFSVNMAFLDVDISDETETVIDLLLGHDALHGRVIETHEDIYTILLMIKLLIHYSKTDDNLQENRYQYFTNYTQWFCEKIYNDLKYNIKFSKQEGPDNGEHQTPKE
ncbi:MAG: helix-turn-helix transcriptional regulator [Oscillospiraceae bacterium]|nr:helix-turn-helix transcriptional regulator [Oscillospiraceae bacterium]